MVDVNGTKGNIDEMRRGMTQCLPRVLIVYLSCINGADQHGISIRSWFHDWPKDRLAQIYSGNEQGNERFCGHTFMLGPAERRWGSYFHILKTLVSPERGVQPGKSKTPMPHEIGENSPAQTRRSYLGRWLAQSGLWELAFTPVISPRMKVWLEAFGPELVYCQGYNLTFAQLPLLISQQLGVPICFHTTDDWPTSLYKSSFAYPLLRNRVAITASRLIDSATLRLAFGEAMQIEYENRYNQPFESVMICDDLDRFRAAAPQRVVADDVVSIVYSGSLGHGRWKSLFDLNQAIATLSAVHLKRFKLTVFTSGIPLEASNDLKELPHVQFLPAPKHEDVPGLFRGADILFLPETMDSEEAGDIRFSVSTKAHLYMMSQRPVLVYGSPIAGVVDYALRDGWGYVVSQRDTGKLAEALLLLSSSRDVQARLVETALEVVLRRHDRRTVARQFQRALIAATARHACQSPSFESGRLGQH